MKKYLLNILMFLSSQCLFAQFRTNNWFPAHWRCDDKEGFIAHVVKEHTCIIFTDTITNEKVALLEIRGNKEKESKLPKKIKIGEYTYTVRGISSLNKDLVEVEIPSTVQFICARAFERAKKLKYVYYEKGDKGSQIKTIGDMAFEGCTSLCFFHIPETVDSIGSNAFKDCTSLVSIELPRYIKAIKDYAFQNCTSLKRIFLSRDLYPKGFIPHEVVESSLKEISQGLFYNCSSLETVELESYNEVKIGDCAFQNCEKLKSVTIGYKIKDVGSLAFNECKSLQAVRPKITDDDVVDIAGTIGKYAFNGCSSIKKLSLIDVDSIKACAFRGCSLLPGVYLNNVKYMGHSVFDDCPNLEYISGLSLNTEFEGNPLYWNSNSTVMNRLNICSIVYSYPYYAKSEVKSQIEEWQKKKEYEKTSQWKLRVTEETRERKVKQLLDSARINYIKKMAPRELKCRIESYDADEEIYKIAVENLNEHKYNDKIYYVGKGIVYIFANVPSNEAKAFKDSWSEVMVNPTYCISENYLGISSCEFKLNGKIYKSPVLYDDETADVALNLSPLEIGVDERKSSTTPVVVNIDNSMDKDIPTVSATNKQTFAVIIGNENYQKVSKVQFAQNDANTFAAYCQKTLGLPQKNVRIYKDATFATMLAAVKDIRNIADAYSGDINVIFYYAGHGIPNESNGSSYLLPIDVDGSQTEVCYPLDRLYSELGGLKAKCVTVFMDACFSGSERGNGMLVAARGVAIKAKASVPQGNMVVFSAATSEQTAYPYAEKGHGLFTYFLLKKLRETKGGCTLGELGDYVVEQVKRESVVSNGKPQIPSVTSSGLIGEGWKSMQLK